MPSDSDSDVSPRESVNLVSEMEKFVAEEETRQSSMIDSIMQSENIPMVINFSNPIQEVIDDQNDSR